MRTYMKFVNIKRVPGVDKEWVRNTLPVLPLSSHGEGVGIRWQVIKNRFLK